MTDHTVERNQEMPSKLSSAAEAIARMDEGLAALRAQRNVAGSIAHVVVEDPRRARSPEANDADASRDGATS
jgi:hypothetical protein